MSANDFYEQEQAAIYKLIREDGLWVHTFSRSGDSCVLCRGIELIGGFLLTEEGDICSSERWMRCDPPQPKRKPIKPSLRFEILKRDNYRCQMCGVTAKDGATLEIDHITPVAKGGANDADNLQVLCRECNAGKSDSCQ